MNYQEQCLNLASEWGFEIVDGGDWIRISIPQGLHFGNGGCGYGTKYGLDIATETEPRSGFIGRILDWLQGIGVRSEIDRRREEAYRDVFLFLAYVGVKEVGV
jgi:hypothetical protein